MNIYYDNSVKKERVIVAYRNVFNFYWKGEKKRINKILMNIKSIVLIPSRVLLFYDVYFKCIIITSYYKTKRIFIICFVYHVKYLEVES